MCVYVKQGMPHKSGFRRMRDINVRNEIIFRNRFDLIELSSIAL